MEVGGWARALFEPGVSLAVGDPTAPAAGLYPEERVAVAAAVERRRREFAAGRRCAREALARLGVPAVPIPARPDRAPAWPEGVVGSITHTARWCAAAVAPRGLLRGLGLDAEPAAPLPEFLWGEVLTEAERSWVRRRPLEERGLVARLAFCAKEAAFKCQYPITGRMLGFDEVWVVMEPGRTSGSLHVEVPGAGITSGGGGASMGGRFVRSGTLLVVAVVIPAAAGPR